MEREILIFSREEYEKNCCTDRSEDGEERYQEKERRERDECDRF